ncbi:MAG: 5-formyltetrahydrofolate cyclo-ligase, partial [Gammaproteobacteria bacterium]|nr:5-formyltetrahydrofolate cyclo-ligase [Gammaproteobacteria bacterium]
LLLWSESNGSHRHLRVTLLDSTLTDARKSLRASLRARRRSVPPGERARAAQLVARNVDSRFHLRSGLRIAVYASLPSELDTAPLIALARRRGCRIYVPRIDRHTLGRKMRFVELTGRQRPNRLGIDEPDGALTLGARWLDVVFLPLVAFDSHGVRLGMGGGYYDRAFEFRRWRTVWHAPRLVGLAYSIQQVERITFAAHDVRLDAVVTEQRAFECAIG